MLTRYRHTSLNLTEEDEKKKGKVEDRDSQEYTYIGIYRLGLETLLKKKSR